MTGFVIRERLDSLTGLRFIAALAVFVRHGGIPGPLGDDLAPQGASAVSFFFILSGFVLTWSHRPDDTPGSFFRRRFARIYPAYLFVFVGVALLLAVDGGRDAIDLVRAIPAIFLVQDWFPSNDVYYAINAVSWSLSCEAFFYALFPVLIVALVKLPPTARRRLLVGLLVVSIAIPLAVRTGQENDGVGFWAIYIFPVTRLAEFVVGMLVALAVRDRERAPLSLGPALALAAVAYVVAGMVPIYLMWVAVTVVPYTLVIWAAAQADLDGRRTVFATKAFLHLGAWSYAFYLVHPMVLREVYRHIDVPYAAQLVVALAGSVLVSALVYKLVERPLERRLRGPAPARAG